MAKGMMDTTGGYPGHDEGSNGGPPNVPSTVYAGSPGTFAPLSGSVDSTINQKGSLGSSGKPEGGE